MENTVNRSHPSLLQTLSLRATPFKAKRIKGRSILKKSKTINEIRKNQTTGIRSECLLSQKIIDQPKSELSSENRVKLEIHTKKISNSKLTKSKTIIQLNCAGNAQKDFCLFLIIKTIVFGMMFWLVSLILFFLQIGINDFCFYPDLCKCEGFLIYLFAMFKDMVNGYFPLIVFTYYGVCFVTKAFYEKPYFRNVYLSNSFLLLIFFYGYDFEDRFQPIHSIIRRRNWIALLLFQSLYVLALNKLHRNFTKDFFRRLMLILGFQTIFFLQTVFMKSFILLYIKDFFERSKDPNYSLDSAKLFLLAYYLFYWFICVCFFHYLFQKIKKEKFLSYNIVIFMIKYIIADVWFIILLNCLTTPMDKVYFWLNITAYLYTLITSYCRNNFLWQIFQRCVDSWLKKKLQKTKPKNRVFGDIVSSSIIHVNLILMCRVITFKFLDYFIYFSKAPQNYQDCTLKESHGVFKILDNNLIFISLTHTLIIVMLVTYALKQKEKKIEYWEEDTPFIGKLIIFLFLFNFSDFGLQCYKEFIER